MTSKIVKRSTDVEEYDGPRISLTVETYLTQKLDNKRRKVDKHAEKYLSSFMSKDEAEQQVTPVDGEAQPFLPCVLGEVTMGFSAMLSAKQHREALAVFENVCDPQSEKEIKKFFKDCVERSVREEKTMLLVVACHGNNSKDKYTLEFGGDAKLLVRASAISAGVRFAREIYPSFKCVGLIEACYANYFDVSCFDASITVGEGKNRGGVVVHPLVRCMLHNEEFTLGDIFKKMTEQFAIFSMFDLSDVNDGETDFTSAKINGNYRFKN